jgi:hypothetical protein
MGRDVSLRWIYVHLIEEYARHNGHADLLRERIDGATGVYPGPTGRSWIRDAKIADGCIHGNV